MFCGLEDKTEKKWNNITKYKVRQNIKKKNEKIREKEGKIESKRKT